MSEESVEAVARMLLIQRQLPRARRAEVQTALATPMDSVVWTSRTAAAVPPHDGRVTALNIGGVIAALWFLRG